MKAIIQVLGGNGYVWDADAFKQQNAVRGLPLELSPEEVALALEKGWGQLAPPDGVTAAAAAAAGKQKASRPAAYEYYEEESWEDDGFMDEGEGDWNAAAAGGGQPEPTWRAALADGAAFTIPTTPAEAAAANAGVQPDEGGKGGAAAGRAGENGSKQPAGAGGAAEGAAAEGAAAGEAAVEETTAEGEAAQPVEWTFPATQEDRHRFWVFRDLHSKGYRLTGGSKFGADYLVYPGDPTLYHAQFCVRLLPFRQPLLPAMLSAATRGSHQARKHLLIASVVEEEEGVEQVEMEEGQQEGRQEGSQAVAAAAGQGQPAGQQPGEQQAEQEMDTQAEQQRAEQQQPVVPGEGAPRLGADAGGTGSRGERFRIRYMTIGPVEGFG